jgi:hypothetical protein
MRYSFRLGKRFGILTPQERAVLERLKSGKITAEEAERELGGRADVKEWRLTLGDDADDSSPTAESSDDASGPPAEETPEEARARELVERIAREVDAEAGG